MSEQARTSQGVAPVVKIADDQGRKMGGFPEPMMTQKAIDLPATLALRQPEMPVHEMKRPLRRLHDGELSPPGFLAAQPQGDLMLVAERPAREKIAISSCSSAGH